MNRPHADERNSIASRALALLTAAVVLTGAVCADLSYVFAADPALTEMVEEAAIAETAEEETFTAETVEEAVIEFVEAEEATTESVKAEEAIEEPSEDAEAELPQESAETLEEMESIPAETVETIETIETVEAVEAVEDELSAYAQDILSKYDGKVVPLNEACSILDEIEEDAARNMQFSFYEGDPVDAAEKENGIVLKGELPEAVTAQAAEVEVSLDTEAGGVLYAYDITLSDGDEEYEPDQAVEVTLNGELIAQANEDGRDLLVIHIADDGTETIVEDVFAEEDRVVFAADGFSVYAVAEAPAPVEIEAQAAEDLTALTSEESLEGFYLSVTKGTNTAYYFQNTLNASGAFELTDNVAAAAVWFLEPVEEGLFLLSTEVGGEARFVTNPKANNAGLSADPAEGALFIISEAASELFWVKLADADKWLQYSGSGKGIRFYTDKNNAGNSRIAFTYASSLEMPEDPYGLDGQAWILLQYGNGTGGAALLAAEKNASALESQSLQVRVNPQNRSESLYVAKDSDASIWTFGAMGGDLYTLCADGLYLEVEGTSLTITTDATEATWFQVIPGAGANAGQIRLATGGRAVSFEGTNGFKTAVDREGASKLWFSLAQLSDLTADDFVVYSASKVSVSDAALTNGSNVILYTRSWNETTKRYDFFAVDADGTLVACYESGDSIQWVGSRENTLLWEFEEYYWEGTEDPNYYYDLYSVSSGRYIAPRIGSESLLADAPVGINLDGRRYGDYYTTILAWDDPHYAYASLKTANGKALSCPMAQAEDFYFAVMQEAGTVLEEIPTVAHGAYGITMKMVDFRTVIKAENGGNTSAEQQAVLGNSEGGAVQYPIQGLLSTDLQDGYPMATLTGKSFAELFENAKEVDHLFTTSTYRGSGYYEFDSTQNFASLQADGTFKVYQAIATHDAGGDKPTLKHGQFFPYNDITAGRYASRNGENLYDALAQPLPDADPRKYEKLHLIDNPNYFFGVEIEATFVQAPNGLDDWGHDIIYEFTGDDDFWLYVDGELVIDLGGIHSALPGTVNYCTGEVNVNGTETTLRDAFESNYRARGLDEAEIEQKLDDIFVQNEKGQYVFREYSTHTMRIFYMERGAGASNLHMRFNLASVRPGQILLSKQISGTDKADYKLAEYAYQIWYETSRNSGFERLTERTETISRVNVADQDTNAAAKYLKSFTPAGSSAVYEDVFFLAPNQTVCISLPEDVTRYYIVECGVNTQVYDSVSVNGSEIEGIPSGDSRMDYATDAAFLSERQRVVFDNHVSADARRSLTITNRLYDLEGQEVTDDPGRFTFRLYLGGENDAELTAASMQDYCVKNAHGEYCRWDAKLQSFVSLGKIDFAELTEEERLAATFQTSMNGAISRIPAAFKVEVRDLLVGTQFCVEEREAEIPWGCEFIEYRREGDSYIISGETVNAGTIRENESPAIEICNRRVMLPVVAPTGIDLNVAPFIAMLGAGLLLTVLMLLRRRA